MTVSNSAFEAKVSYQSKLLNSYRTSAVGDGTKKCYADRSSYVTVTTRDWRGASVIGPEVEQFFCEMVPLQLTGPKSGSVLQILEEKYFFQRVHNQSLAKVSSFVDFLVVVQLIGRQKRTIIS